METKGSLLCSQEPTMIFGIKIHKTIILSIALYSSDIWFVILKIEYNWNSSNLEQSTEEKNWPGSGAK
jgi:hypothetical protein